MKKNSYPRLRVMALTVAAATTASVLAADHKCPGCPKAHEGITVRTIPVGTGYSGTSVNTAVFRTNSITTFGNSQYISYYDPDGHVVTGKRELGDSTWTIGPTRHTGNIRDGHNIISIGIDGEGVLHSSFDHHGHPLRYARAESAGSIALGDKMPMTGIAEGNVTYPEFYRMANGDLLFAYRSGASGRGDLMMNRYSLKDHTWSKVCNNVIDGEGERNAYWQMCVDANDVIHLSWVWRETWLVETNHDMCYARSDDGGKTWKKSNGELYTLPITQATAEVAWRIPQNSELINQTSMSADRNSNPYIMTYWRSAASDVPQYRLMWHDGKRWEQREVSERTTPFSLSGGGTKMIPVSRPQMVVDGKTVAYLFRDAERGSKVSMAYSLTGPWGKWQTVDLTDFPVDAWEPSYDRELWKERGLLHVFVQHTRQGDGERTVEFEPQPVMVLEVDFNALRN